MNWINFPGLILLTLLLGWCHGQCPDGYQSNGGMCLYMGNNRVPWQQAMDTCAQQNATLFNVKKQSDWDVMVQNVPQQQLTSIWIGLHYDTASGTYAWSDGTPYDPSTDWAPWGSNQPNTNAGQCVSVKYDIKLKAVAWFMTSCTTTLVPICVKPQQTTVGTGTPYTFPSFSPITCPPGFNSFGGRCMSYSQDPVTYREAEANCVANNSYVLFSKEEWMWRYAEYFIGSQLPNFWVGLSYNEATQQFEYADGTVYHPDTDWAAWCSGQPGTPGQWAGNCVNTMQDYSSGHYCWYMADCEQGLYGVCLLSMPTTTPLSTTTTAGSPTTTVAGAPSPPPDTPASAPPATTAAPPPSAASAAPPPPASSASPAPSPTATSAPPAASSPAAASAAPSPPATSPSPTATPAPAPTAGSAAPSPSPSPPPPTATPAPAPVPSSGSSAPSPSASPPSPTATATSAQVATSSAAPAMTSTLGGSTGAATATASQPQQSTASAPPGPMSTTQSTAPPTATSAGHSPPSPGPSSAVVLQSSSAGPTVTGSISNAPSTTGSGPPPPTPMKDAPTGPTPTATSPASSVSTTSANCNEKQTGNFLPLMTNGYLTYQPFSVLQNTTNSECAMACMQQSQCASFDWNIQTGQCHLLTEKYTPDCVHFVPSPNHQHFDLVNVDRACYC